ncbi:MAG: efflux RND transporter periplasmic adaptor subunit [Chitinivibrionales bacterium]
MKKGIIIGGAALLLFTAGCNRGEQNDAAGQENANTTDTIPVSIYRVKPESFSVRGEYYGSVSGIEEAEIVSTAGGRVDALYAEEGDYVKAGKHLGSINADEAVNSYNTALLNEKIARDNYERLQAHLKDGNASQVAVDQARLNWLNSKSALLQAQRVRRGALCITPISGTVVSRHIDLHQEVAPGTPTFSVAQLNTMKITFGIPESDIAEVAEGAQARVTVDLLQGNEWNGKLVRLSRKLSDRTRTFDAEVHVNNGDGALISGLTARVDLALRELDSVVAVPTGAVRNEDKETYVMIVKDGRARYTVVQTGASDDKKTIITKGVAFDDSLIVKGYHLVANGTPVSIQTNGNNND